MKLGTRVCVPYIWYLYSFLLGSMGRLASFLLRRMLDCLLIHHVYSCFFN
jgi:hypothetical protein